MMFSAIGGKTLPGFKRAIGILSLVAVFAMQGVRAASLTPQDQPAGSSRLGSGTVSHRSTPRHGSRRRVLEKRASNAKPQTLPRPEPATVTLANGSLTIDAKDSSLGQILQQVANMSGMTVDGLSKSSQVFGVYGPGNPRDVLTALLTGSGYNFLMVGASRDGAPRELLLTAEGNRIQSSQSSQQSGVSKSEPPQDEVPVEEPLGPGAIAHVPPTESQEYQSDDNANTRAEQNMQRLQQMHDQMQQQQQNAPQ